jgi:hypothetical protein
VGPWSSGTAADPAAAYRESQQENRAQAVLLLE